MEFLSFLSSAYPGFGCLAVYHKIISVIRAIRTGKANGPDFLLRLHPCYNFITALDDILFRHYNKKNGTGTRYLKQLLQISWSIIQIAPIKMSLSACRLSVF